MLKKYIYLFLCVYLLILPVCAAESNAVSLTPGNDFSVYAQDPAAVAEIVGLPQDELADFCNEQNIVYLAVNRDNTRQIRVSVYETAFSENVGNLSALSDEKITALVPRMTGGTHGEVVKNGGQKFLKEQLRSSDSGGDYILTRYTTVAAKKIYLLAFYTAVGTPQEDAEIIFATYSSPDFLGEGAKTPARYGGWILAAMVLLFAVSGFLVFTLIRDIRGDRKDADENDTIDET